MADFEDSNTPTWENCIAGPDQPARRGACAPSRSRTRTARSTSSARRLATLLVRPARLAPAREALARSMASRCSGGIFDFALYFFHNAKPNDRAGQRPVLLPAQAGEPPRGAPLERHLRDDAGRARHPAGHDQGDGADRDDPRRVRDGRDPVRAARPLRRPQLRPLGLHLQLHQEVPQPPGLRAGRPRAGHDDHALHAAPTACSASRPATGARRPRDGRHGGADPDQERPGGERGGAREGPPGQGARGERRPRRDVGRAPGPRGDRDGGVRRGHDEARTRSTRSCEDVDVTAHDLLDLRSGGADHRGRRAH